jgi:hypothetical protein
MEENTDRETMGHSSFNLETSQRNEHLEHQIMLQQLLILQKFLLLDQRIKP